MCNRNKVLVIDFGSQYSQLIVKQIRDCEVYADICCCNSEIPLQDYDAIILSGGPQSVENNHHHAIVKKLLRSQKPILGICYGMQLIHKHLGGEVDVGNHSEFGDAEVSRVRDHLLLDGLPLSFSVWMSHNDSVTSLASGFVSLARTDKCNAISANDSRGIYTVQFHPEVEHSVYGKQIIRNFLFLIAKVNATWRMEDLIAEKISYLSRRVTNGKVLLAISGGLDSSVVAEFLSRACGGKVIGVFVDTGLIRDWVKVNIIDYFRDKFKNNFHVIEARDKFMGALKGVTDPEEKRRIIGGLFLELFRGFLREERDIVYLAQGTIQSDLIESGKRSGSSETIKTHHNTLEELRKHFELVEPISEFFKHEVKELAIKLSLPPFILGEHPFPGPGYAIRVMGEVTEEKVGILRRVDELFVSQLKQYQLYHNISQAFTVLLDTRSTGIRGDKKHYGYVVAIRCINTTSFMTARVTEIPWEIILKISSKITNEIPEVSRVVYDLTTKPPGTIEWE